MRTVRLIIVPLVAGLLWWCYSPISVQAGDPVTPAPIAAVSIVAPKECTGTGTRNDPIQFDSSTKCFLRLTGSSTATWDISDAPPDSEIVDRLVVFSCAETGLFQVIAHGEGTFLKAWLEIKGPNGPPTPVNQLVTRLKAALVGPDAKADAAKLAGMCGATADAIQSGKLKTMADFDVAWKAAQSANQWPAGKYPTMPDIIRTAIPPAEETLPIPANAAANLRVLEQTAKAVANG